MNNTEEQTQNTGKPATLVEQLRAVEAYVQSGTRFGDINLRGRQGEIIRQWGGNHRDNTSLRKALTGFDSCSIFYQTNETFDILHKNYECPEDNAILERLVDNLSQLIGELPAPRSQKWYNHSRNALWGLGGGIIGAGTALLTNHSFLNSLGMGAIGFVALTLSGYEENTRKKKSAFRLLEETHARLLPNAKYLDGKIDELFGGS